MNYNKAIQEANQLLLSGDKKKALNTFKNSVSGDEIKAEQLQNAANQKIVAKLGE